MFIFFIFEQFIYLMSLFIWFSSFYLYHLMVFHWSLRDSKSPQISRTLLSNLCYLNNAVVWMVRLDLRFPTLPFPILSASLTIGITVTFLFHSFSVLWQGLSYICRSLPPDRTWHKVGLKWGLGEGKVGHEQKLEPCGSVLLIEPLNVMWA